MKKLVLRELSYEVTGLCFDVHNKLGRFCREKQYADELEKLFIMSKLPYKREVAINELVRDGVEGNRPDFLIDGKIIVDLKAEKVITKKDYYQMQRYLHNAGLELGMIVNFRDRYLKPKRVLNASLYSGHSEKNSDH